MTSDARLASVDALRGAAVAAMIVVNNPGDWASLWGPLAHADWDGCTPTDLVFPGFLFVAGLSLALGLPAQPLPPAQRRERARALAGRVLRLLLLGLALNLVAHLALGTPHWRGPGVLQRIALCLAGAGAAALWLRPRGQALLCLALLALQAVLLGPGPWPPDANPAHRLDSALLGPWAWQYDAATGLARDPEGLLGTPGALATTLLGLLAGPALRAGRWPRLGLACAALLLAGWAAQGVWPLNKALWTPSFVLWTAGWALALQLLAYALVDRWQAPPCGLALGRNAIGAYCAAWLLTCALDGSGLGPVLWAALSATLQPLLGPVGASHAWALLWLLPIALAARAALRRGWIWRI